MRPRFVSFVFSLVLIATFLPSAHAGGWVTAAVVDDLDSIVVGEPFAVRYVVRAHGVVGHEMEGMETILQFVSRESSQVVEAVGRATADPKTYEATVTLPIAGEWKWKVIVHNYLPDGTIESPMPSMVAMAPGETGDASAARSSGMTTIVTITDAGFFPSSVEVEVGDTITWVNDGMMPHQVASDAPDFATSPIIEPGEAFFQTMVEPGTFDYLCPPHPSMTGAVIVS